MIAEALWKKLIDSKYQCQCIRIDEFHGKLTVLNINDNTLLLNREIVLKEPFDYDQWESFCIAAINT